MEPALECERRPSLCCTRQCPAILSKIVLSLFHLMPMNYCKNENHNSNNGQYWWNMYYVTYFTHTLYPLAQSSQHSNERDAFSILNVQMKTNEMQRLCELPDIPRLVRRGRELTPISVSLQTNTHPISHYSRLKQSLWVFFFLMECR